MLYLVVVKGHPGFLYFLEYFIYPYYIPIIKDFTLLYHCIYLNLFPGLLGLYQGCRLLTCLRLDYSRHSWQRLAQLAFLHSIPGIFHRHSNSGIGRIATILAFLQVSSFILINYYDSLIKEYTIAIVIFLQPL